MAHLLLMSVGQVQPVPGQELRLALDQATPRRPGHHLDLCLGTGGKDRCSRQHQLVRTDAWSGRGPVLSPPGTDMVAQDAQDNPRSQLDPSVLGQDGLGVLAPEVAPGYERDQEALHNEKREMHTFVMYMLG